MKSEHTSDTGQIELRWIGQAGFIIRSGKGTVVVIDPYLSHSVDTLEGWTRISEVPLKATDINPDIVLCTHDHLDHTDPETVLSISQSSSSHFVGPVSSYQTFIRLGIPKQRLTCIKANDVLRIGDVDIKVVIAKHTKDSVGYVLTMDQVDIYHTGDTLYDASLVESVGSQPDIVLTCINGKFGNMGPEDAAKLVCTLHPKVAVPMHYGMFKENTIEPSLFRKVLKDTCSKVKVVVMQLNSIWEYP